MKVPDREITRVGNKTCAKGSREREDEKRGRRQRKDYSTLADLDAHGGGGPGTAPLIPLSRASRPTRPEFPSIAISDAPLPASLATLHHPTRLLHLLLPSPTPQTRGQLHLALYLTVGCFPCLRLEIDVASIVGSVSGKAASAHSVE
jgi:hypothetical protein